MIAAAWLDPDVYAVELEAGRARPLPDYVGTFALTDKLGVRVTAAETLADTPHYLIHAATMLLKAEQIVQTQRESDAKRK